jgi:hypothetical protein
MTAQLSIEAPSYESARSALEKQLTATKGYIEHAAVEHRDGNVSSAELTLRVPAGKLTSLIAECRALGTVLSEDVRSQDISEEYYDAAARLKNARRLESAPASIA